MIARDSIRLINQCGIHVFVRVNSIATDLTIEDLRSTVVEGLGGVMLAKTDIARVCEMLKEAEKCSGVPSYIFVAQMFAPRIV
jgi:citrate lyase beta subunit